MAKPKNDGEARVGRKPRRFTASEKTTLLGVVNYGLSLRTACEVIEWEWQTFRAELKRDPQFATHLSARAAKSKVAMAALLVEKAKAGNLQAIIYWLKTRCTEFREVILEGEIDDNVTAADFRFE